MRAKLLVLLSASLILGSGCGGGEPEPSAYAQLLRFVPNEPEYRRAIVIVDYGALRALPAPEGVEQTDSEFAGLTFTAESYIGFESIAPLSPNGGSIDAREIEHWESGLGLSIGDIDHSLLTRGSSAPEGPYPIAAILGRFDAGETSTRLDDCAECLQPERLEHGGVAYYDWGDDTNGSRRFAPPVYDHLGRGGQFRFTDDYILRAFGSSSFLDALDASTQAESVIDRPEFRMLADQLEDLDLLVAFLSDEHQGPAWAAAALEVDGPTQLPPASQAALDPPSDQAILRPYDTYAIGGGFRDGGSFMAIVLAHDSPAAARENVGRLQERLDTTRTSDGEPWSAVFSSWEVDADGQTVTAIFHGMPRWLVASVLEPLLLHE